ncbi:MAG: RNA polymerase sigma factor [Patescibacteria group bacterium]|nr:RNA polymerase sigma factor [Patescibacteria group bacterium]
MEINEEKIIIKCQAGDLADFGCLYDKYIKKIYDFVYYKTLHKETAEDLTSKTFFKALENINNYSSTKGSFSSWLYKIARNTVIDNYRTEKKTIDITEIWDLKSDEDIEKDAGNRQQLEEIKKYLDKLKPEQKEIVIMRIWDGLSYREIAAITGKSEAGCKMMFSRTIAILRKEMPLALFILLLLKLK